MSRSVSGTTAPTPCSSHSARQRRHVRRVVDPRHRDADVGGVLGRRKRVRIRGDDGRVLGERRHDVVALADAREQDGYALGGCHPPVSPL